MHWTTEILNKYKEALVAFDTNLYTGFKFLVQEGLDEGICRWMIFHRPKVSRDYIHSYARKVTGGKSLWLAPIL